ncbi:MAG: urease accessory protein UreF [Gemmobacter sp.]
MTAHPSAPVLPDPAQIDRTALLTLVQWLSPAFPVGSFAYSHGLEAAIALGHVTTPAQVGDWIGDVLAHGAGRTDAVLLAHALQPGADHDGLTALARALCATGERLRETEEMGAALTLATNALNGTGHPPAPLPVALGRAAAPLALPVPLVLSLALQGFATMLVLAAVRFLPMGQTEGQRLLSALHPLILRLADAAAGAPLSAIGSAAIRADIASARHETLDVRIFRT